MSAGFKVASIVLNNFVNDSRVLKEALTLQSNGYCVTVVALHEQPLAEFETHSEVQIHRVKLSTRKWSKNFLVQVIKYLEFIVRAVKKYRKHDILHCNDLNALPVGVLIKLLLNRKAKIVYDAHEYATESNGLKGLKKSCVKFMEKHLIGFADEVITVSNKIAEDYEKLYQIEKPHLILNTPNFEEISRHNLFREEFSIRDDQKIFLYQGALASGRGLELLLESITSRATDEFVIVFMGYGAMTPVIEEAAASNSTVFYKSAVPYTDILKYSSSADFGVYYGEDTCLSYRYALPNKIFEYLMAGIPVIASKLPELENLIDGYSVGVLARVGSVSALSEAFEQAAQMDTASMKDNIDKVREIYNWEKQEAVLLKLYGSL